METFSTTMVRKFDIRRITEEEMLIIREFFNWGDDHISESIRQSWGQYEHVFETPEQAIQTAIRMRESIFRIYDED